MRHLWIVNRGPFDLKLFIFSAFYFVCQTVWLVGQLHQQQHVRGRLQVVQLHRYTSSSSPSTVCFSSFMANVLHLFFNHTYALCRPFGCLRLWVFLVEQPGAAVHQLRQWEAAAALCRSLSEGAAGGICIRGTAVVLYPLPRQPEMSGSDRGKSHRHLLPA